MEEHQYGYQREPMLERALIKYFIIDHLDLPKSRVN
jgi:hypothetical protein